MNGVGGAGRRGCEQSTQCRILYQLNLSTPIDAVIFVYDKGLMTGTSTNPMLFSPNATLTRGMVVTVLYRMEGEPKVSSTSRTPNSRFTDVADGLWYSDAVAWAAANGIVSGYGDGKFGPNDNITREQMATIMYNYAKFAGHGPQGAWAIRLDFADVGKISDWASEGAMYCYMKGIITGKPGNLFDPKAGATRAEFATVLMRFIEALE